MNEYLSAELASLRMFKKNEELGLSKDDVIALLSTDTEEGKFCADVNKNVLDKSGWCNVLEPTILTGLKTKRTKENEKISQSFIDAGLKKLKEEVEKLLSKEYKNKYFNITGGFKGVIPFATCLAIEKGINLIYLYEESDDLIVIKPPTKFKCSFEETLQNARIFHKEPGGF